MASLPSPPTLRRPCSTNLYLYLSLSLPLLSLYLSTSVFLYFCLSLLLSISTSVYLYLWLSFSLSVCLSLSDRDSVFNQIECQSAARSPNTTPLCVNFQTISHASPSPSHRTVQLRADAGCGVKGTDTCHNSATKRFQCYFLEEVGSLLFLCACFANSLHHNTFLSIFHTLYLSLYMLA